MLSSDRLDPPAVGPVDNFRVAAANFPTVVASSDQTIRRPIRPEEEP
jgi:hypothetical protein